MVNKITTPPTTSELIGTVNEIIDDKQDKLTSDNAGTDIEITDSADVEIDETVTGDNTITLESAKYDSLASLTLYGKCEQRNLPSGYTQVEYLQSSGTQWIDTGYYPNQNTKFEISGTQGNSDCALFGLLSVFYCFSSSGAITYYGFCGNLGSFNYTMRAVPIILTMSASDGIVINGTKYANITAGSTTANYSMTLFGRMDNSTGEVAKLGNHIIKYAKIYENNILIHNLIPARRNSDRVLGMYDTVTGTFLTNAGTGTFTAGTNVTVPTPYTPMDIVSNNGVVKVNTTGIGKNAIDTSDTEQGYLTSTVGQQPNIRSSTASVVIKRAIKVRNGKKYKFSYYSNVAGSRESNIVDNNGIVTLKSNLACDVGLNEYIIEANTDGYLWVTVQLGDFATVKPTAYEIGQIYTDGTVETVEIHTKNLFDKNNALLNTTVNETGSFETNDSFNCSNYIPVQYGKTYIRSNNGTRFGIRYHLYDSNKNWLGYFDTATTGLIVVSNSSAKYVAFAISKTVNLDNVQVELGSTITTYEPYFNGGTANAEMLLKVDSYKDEQELLTGNITRNIGIKVFDGTENWQSIVTPYFSLAKSDITPSALPGDNFNSICSHFVRSASGGTLSGIVAFYWGRSYLNINIDISGSTTVAQFKAWLAEQYANGTPVIIVYPLATATTETVTAQPLTVQTGTNIVSITQASIDTLSLTAEYTKIIQSEGLKISFANDSGYITSSALTPYALTADLATVATTGAYSDLSGTPTIPTVNNATLTITQGGVTKGTFTANASSDVSIDLDAGGGGGSGGISYVAGTGISFTDGGYQQNFSVIGSPTISSDYIASNFTVDDYLKLPIKFDVYTNTWEMQLKFTTGSSLPVVPILGPSNGIDCQIPLILINGSYLYLLLSSNGSNWNIANTRSSSAFVTTNTTYWVKLIYSGRDYKLYKSTDGSLWDLQITINSSTPIYQPQTVEPGIGINKWSSNPSNWNAFNGTVDLKECYIKINDVDFWRAFTTKTAINCTLTAGTGVDITSDVISVEGVKDQRNTSTAIKTWTGTRAQYDAIVTKDSNTLYNVTDDSNMAVSLLQTIYPVGSIYIGTMNTCPLAALFGTWTLVAADRVLQGSGTNSAGSTVAAGLPNITGNNAGELGWGDAYTPTGAFKKEKNGGANGSFSSTGQSWVLGFDASRSSSIYGNSTTVQPPAYVVNIWERTA